MKVGDQAHKVRVRRHLNAVKGVLKQAAGTPVELVDRLGVGVEEVTELLARFKDPKGFRNPLGSFVCGPPCRARNAGTR